MDTARPAQRLDGPHETEAPCSSAYDFKRVSILRGLPLSGCGSDGQRRFPAFHVALSCRRSWDGLLPPGQVIAPTSEARPRPWAATGGPHNTASPSRGPGSPGRCKTRRVRWPRTDSSTGRRRSKSTAGEQCGASLETPRNETGPSSARSVQAHARGVTPAVPSASRGAPTPRPHGRVPFGMLPWPGFERVVRFFPCHRRGGEAAACWPVGPKLH